MDQSVPMRVLFFSAIVWTLLGLAPYHAAAATSGAWGKASANPSDIDEAASDERATVTLDGEQLVQVAGFPTYPAAERAKAIKQRIEAIAADRSVAIDSLRVVDSEDRTRIMAGDRLAVAFLDFDAPGGGVSRQILAERARMKIAEAIASYRN